MHCRVCILYTSATRARTRFSICGLDGSRQWTRHLDQRLMPPLTGANAAGSVTAAPIPAAYTATIHASAGKSYNAEAIAAAIVRCVRWPLHYHRCVIKTATLNLVLKAAYFLTHWSRVRGCKFQGAIIDSRLLSLVFQKIAFASNN